MPLHPKRVIVPAQALGGDTFHIGKDLAGNFVFTVNNQSIRMTPSQTQDLAHRLLTALGHKFEVIDMPGPKLVS